MNASASFVLSDIMPYLLDAAAVALFVLMVLIGYKRGFFKTIMRLVSLAVSLVAAALLSQPAAQFVYDTLLRSHVTGFVSDAFAKTSQTVSASVDSLLSGLPGILRHALSADGLTSSAEVLSRAGVSAGTAPAEASDAVLGRVVEPLTVTLLSGACFIVIFILCLIAMLLITRAADLATKLPVLKQVNGALGLLVGIAEGIVLVWVLSQGLSWLAATIPPNEWLSPAALDRTWILSRLIDGTLFAIAAPGAA